MIKRIAALSTLALAVVACSTTPTPENNYYMATVDVMEPVVSYKNEPLDGYAVATTERVRNWYRPLFQTQSKVFFRGYFYDDGSQNIQIYFKTESDDWLFPQSLNFGSPLRSRDAAKVWSDVRCTSSSCDHYEDVVIKLTSDDVDYIVSQPESFLIRLKTKSGRDVDRMINPKELEALLRRYENEQT